MIMTRTSLKRGMAAAVLAVFASLAVGTASAGDTIYKSKNKIDFIKLDGAKKAEKEGGLNHPYTFTGEQMKAILGSIKFNKKILMMKDIENRNLFDETNVEFLTPYLIEAFQKAKPDEVVVISYFTRDTKLVIQNDRLTVMRAFLKNDGLHIKFTKTYAKMLGDRTTQGAAMASANARGMRVSLELQPGQNRVSWDPEELVFDLSQFTGVAPAIAEKTPPKKEKVKKEKKGKEIVAEDAVKTEDAGNQSVKDRLKQLDDLKKDEMITEKEYQAKRKELLKEL